MRVAPAAYGTRIRAFAFATYSVSPTSAMPKGECRPERNTLRISATPSRSASRSRVMRLPAGTPEPAFFFSCFITAPLRPRMPLLPGGASDSATSTSPSGSTYSQRGCDRPSANRVTRQPLAGMGAAPRGQPTAGAISTVGTSDLRGAGSAGSGPLP